MVPLPTEGVAAHAVMRVGGPLPNLSSADLLSSTRISLAAHKRTGLGSVQLAASLLQEHDQRFCATAEEQGRAVPCVQVSAQTEHYSLQEPQ